MTTQNTDRWKAAINEPTIKEMAEATGRSVQVVRRWRTGGLPDLDDLPAICAALDADLLYLFPWLKDCVK